MSRQFRYRMAAVLASGVLFGVPLLGDGTASAEPLGPADRRVTFGGGALGVACGSQPSVESVTVPAESTLHVINRTGHDARLELGGTPRGVIPDDGAAEVVFRRGTTPVVLAPDCPESDEPVPMMVTAVPSDPAAAPDAASDDSDSASRPSVMSDPAAAAPVAGPAAPATGAPRSRPMRHAAGAGASGQRRAAGERRTVRARTPAGAAIAGAPAAAAKSRERIPRTSQAGVPRSVVTPPAARDPLPAADRVPAAGPPAADPVRATPGEAPAADPDRVTTPAAEPVAAIQPIRTGRPIGLLGVIATVCTLGVLIAAIRAIVSQRASRANVA
ncbi:hypothetical protein [Actinoplanes teichomyceticus]|uniref:Uncharacterized protein n=1 Tax=Actinoplanes teichomyceticus TaxID=1867 RepID=A0A561WRE5_ACTTI|nr:hypothetical protein [Actinoplanes teichomyceticus]TWG26419.1 hypothetical protein FHX34_1011403 [Actinoplanes teichomyceticus]GIF11494.1 hypothetical protein Ate01nite_15260 [Actinoplanes teichomyceticus]